LTGGIYLKRKTRKTLTITAEHAVRALSILIHDGKIAISDVAAALKRREQLIEELRQRLLALELGAVSAMKSTGRKVERRAKRKMTAARRAAMRLHGRYLGTIRPLSKADRAKVKAIREKSGVLRAIAAARKMGK
jgi:hypothetical protein